MFTISDFEGNESVLGNVVSFAIGCIITIGMFLVM